MVYGLITSIERKSVMCKRRKKYREFKEKQIETCNSKVTFFTRKEARDKAKRLNLRNFNQAVYRCPICGNYHLTTVKENKET